MGALPKPDVPAGSVRVLSDELHRLHHLAGWPSLRDMAKEVGCSHTTISAAFSGPRVPRWGLLELIVEALGGDTGTFHQLWLRASGAAAPGAVGPGDLPADVPASTGPADGFAELDRLLAAADGTRAVVISVVSGTAGVGRTALAAHCAQRVADRFPDGQLYVDLRGCDPGAPVSAAQALSGFLRELGVDSADVPRDPAERVARYRTLLAGRRMLVLLDNACSVDQVRDLLPGTPGCYVVVTSRDALPALVTGPGAVRVDLHLPGSGSIAPPGSRTSTPAARTDDSPVQVGTIPPRADSFQERAVAEALGQAAAPGRTTVLTQVVAGLGGVGKTQLAAEFARRLLDRGDADLVLWIPALSRDSVVSGYVQAAAHLALGPDDEEPERTAGRLLAWLATTSRRWLVVLDDLGGATDIRDLWPPDRPSGRTVVTTRRRDADLLAGRALMEVTAFTEAEAVGYVTRKLRSRPHLADDVHGVVADLDALPLALGHATAYMIDLDLPCSAYRVRFADRGRGLAELFPHPDALYEGGSRTVATTWTLSIDAADRLPPTGIARPLLAIISALNPNGIPEAVLTAPSAVAHLSARCGRTPSHADIRDGLRGLHRFHLVTHENGVVRMHALVQRAVRDSLGEDRATAVARVAADAVLEVWPAIDTSDGQLLRANAMALQDNWAAAIWDPQRGIHPVMLRTMTSLGAAVQLEEAIRLCEQLNRQAVEHIGALHPDTLALRNQLATWLGDAGRAQDAVVALGELVPDIVAALGPDHPTAITARCNLGYQWGQAGYPARAVTELTKALADQVRVLGPEDPAVLITRHRIVYWQTKAGDTSNAVGELTDLLRLSTRVLGPEHRETLELRGALASARAEVVGHAQSAAEMREVLDDMRRALGPDHRDVSVLRLNLAARQRLAGDLTTAAAALDELLVERIGSHGPYHRDTIATHHCLSQVLTDLGDYARAAAELEEVVEGLRRVVGPLHQDTVRHRYELERLRARMAEDRGEVGLPSDLRAARRSVSPDAR